MVCTHAHTIVEYSPDVLMLMSMCSALPRSVLLALAGKVWQKRRQEQHGGRDQVHAGARVE